ncbi:MAG: AMP-binding protein [Deferribacteraceae bacterium]|jgi:acetyl-CoA synthetase|nr:AMP-binding protein [Deferribacteraceae bacterium]
MLEKFLKRTDFSSPEDFKNNYELIVPENFNFAYDVVDEWAKIAPNKLAMCWTNSAGEHRNISFGMMQAESDKMAAYLQGLGIGRGDVVMLVLKRRFEFWYTLLALHKLGAIAAPATHMLTESDLVYRNNAAQIKMIISTDDSYLVKNINDAMPESTTVKTLVCCGEAVPEGWEDMRRDYPLAHAFVRPDQRCTNDEPLLLYFTSGTTGHPKMVVHNCVYPLGHIVTAKYWHNLSENSLHLTVADTGWAKAVWGKIYGQWIAGAAVFTFDHDVFKPKTMLNYIEQFHITSFCAPPTVYGAFMREDIAKFNLSSLKYCTAAGEPLSPALYEAFYEATGLKIHEAFGQTETTPTVVTFPWREPKPGSMGVFNPAYDMALVNDDGEPAAIGEPGEIIIRLDRFRPMGLFTGYYRDEALTAAAFEDNVYRTGDIARMDEDGYLWFMGRNDDVIKSSGYRVGSFEVESCILTHPYVLECAVTGVKDDIRGQVIKATVALLPEYRDKANNKFAKELQQYVKEKTASYKMPRIVEFVNELPKTTNGKIRRMKQKTNA